MLMDISQINALVADDLQRVNDLIQQRLQSDVALINQLGHYIINSGGKRLRPILVLLSSRACGYTGDKHIACAAIIEFIHTATLLHDDVVDASQMRRGRETANVIWGNESAVLVGDFLYSRAFEMMVDVNSMRVMDIMSHATNTIAEGEVMQLMYSHDADTSEARYMEVIQSKTAKLFEAASQLGAVLTEIDDDLETAMAAYGMHLGTAFQLIDDVLDYRASPEEMGKNVGDDLAEGNPTLPLIYSMAKGNPEQSRMIRKAIEDGDLDKINKIVEAVQATGAIAYTEAIAKQQAQSAMQQLDKLAESEYKSALVSLAQFSVERGY